VTAGFRVSRSWLDAFFHSRVVSGARPAGFQHLRVPLSPRRAGAPPACAVLLPLEGSCSYHSTNRDSPRGAHENSSELSFKVSCPRYTSTSNYATSLQHCMSMGQPNTPMTASVLLKLSRQSTVAPTYLRGLWGLPQHSPQHPAVRAMYATARPHPALTEATSPAKFRNREIAQVDHHVAGVSPAKSTSAKITKITIDVKQTSRGVQRTRARFDRRRSGASAARQSAGVHAAY